MTIRKSLILAATTVVVALVLSACATGEVSEAPAYEPVERSFNLLAVQHDMERHVDRTPFPDTLENYDLSQMPGLRLSEPDEDGIWSARAYVFAPATIAVNQGDEVTLRLFGIHGDEHPSVISGYDINFNIKRGEYEEVTFTADKAGVFEILCAAHLPSMVGQLVVLPSS